MKKTALTIVSLLFCFIIFAQEVKPCLFIGRYDTEKKFMCSDQALVHEEVKDRQEYDVKRTQFLEEHKGSNPITDYVSSKECVIVYQFQINRSGYSCFPSIYALKKGTSIENCKTELASVLAKDPKQFKTQPNIVFTWQGKGGLQKQTLTEDFGGVTAKFTLVAKPNGGDFVVAQFTNKTSNQRAILSIKTADGTILPNEYLKPGAILTKKYDTKSLDIQVTYDNNIESKAPSLIDDAKNAVRKLLDIENGKLKTKPTASMGGRG